MLALSSRFAFKVALYMHSKQITLKISRETSAECINVELFPRKIHVFGFVY